MCEQIGLNLFVRREFALRIACENMDFVRSFAELMAEVIRYPPGSADSVREEDVCQH